MNTALVYARLIGYNVWGDGRGPVEWSPFRQDMMGAMGMTVRLATCVGLGFNSPRLHQPVQIPTINAIPYKDG